MRHRKRQLGFTLPEMMIAVAIMAIGLSMALPGFRNAIASQRLSASSNEVLAVLNYARMEAVRLRGRVVVCPTTNGTSCASSNDWSHVIVFQDTNRDGSRATNEPIVRRWDFRDANLVLTQTAGSTPQRVVFGASGLAQPGTTTAAMTQMRICSKGLTSRSNIISLQAGGARSAKGNGNGCT